MPHITERSRPFNSTERVSEFSRQRKDRRAEGASPAAFKDGGSEGSGASLSAEGLCLRMEDA